MVIIAQAAQYRYLFDASDYGLRNDAEVPTLPTESNITVIVRGF